MLPATILSSQPVTAPLVDLVNTKASLLLDYERGGVALNDPSQGLRVKLWTIRYESPDVIVSAPGVADIVLFSRTNITEIGLAFDQNMRPFVAFVESGQAKYWWFDTAVPGQVFSNLDVTAINPRCCLDDSRPLQLGNSDIILAYTRSGSLYYRQQRDRFLTERLLASSVGGTLESIGMNRGLRLQFKMRGDGPPTSGIGYLVGTSVVSSGGAVVATSSDGIAVVMGTNVASSTGSLAITIEDSTGVSGVEAVAQQGELAASVGATADTLGVEAVAHHGDVTTAAGTGAATESSGVEAVAQHGDVNTSGDSTVELGSVDAASASGIVEAFGS